MKNKLDFNRISENERLVAESTLNCINSVF